jgi:hypothetical protein
VYSYPLRCTLVWRYDVLSIYIYYIYNKSTGLRNSGCTRVSVFQKAYFQIFFFLIVIVINVIDVYNKYKGFKKVLVRPLKACLRHGRPFKADIYNYPHRCDVMFSIFLLSFLFIIYNIYNNNNTDRRVHPCFRIPVINIFKCFFEKKKVNKVIYA